MSESSPVARCPQCGAVLPANAPQGLCPKCLFEQVAAPTESGPVPTHQHLPPPARDAVAGAFPHLEILDLIGQGGMGCVFKARQPQLNRFVALKLLPEALARDAAFAARFTREAQALAALNHPSIVTIHDFGQANGFFYLLMEFVDGVNLRQALSAGRFTPEQALSVVPPICDALQFAHERGIVHRDIKPENILLDREGRVKIADFGIAKLVGHDAHGVPLSPTAGRGTPGDAPLLTHAGEVVGTPQYMAPEQTAAPRSVDRRADIYSLGVVFYEMLTGELPGDRLQPPSRKVHVDVRLDEIVLRALEKAPELRYQTAAEFRTQVETLVLNQAPAADKAAPTAEELGRKPSVGPARRALLAGLFFFAAACALGNVAFCLVKLERGGPSHLALQATLWFIGAIGFGIAGFRRLDLKHSPRSPVSARAIPTPSGSQRLAFIVHLLCWLLPPLLFTGFLLGGHRRLDMDLDADERFFVGLIGLPLSGALGVLLSWGLRLMTDRRGGNTGEATPLQRRPWFWHLVVGGIMLGISEVLGGGALVLMQLLSRETHWNPDLGELSFTILLVGGMALTALAATLLGFAAWRRMRRAADPLRDQCSAAAMACFWPVLLLTAIVPSILGERDRREWQAAYDARRAAQAEVVVLRWLPELRSPQVDQRLRAIGHLMSEGRWAKAAVPDLIQVLNDENDLVRLQAAVTLGYVGESAGPTAAAALQQALSDSSQQVRHQAAVALARVDRTTTANLAALMDRLTNRPPDDPHETWPIQRREAAEALGGMGDRARPALPLLRALERERGGVGDAARKAIDLIEKDAPARSWHPPGNPATGVPTEETLRR